MKNIVTIAVLLLFYSTGILAHTPDPSPVGLDEMEIRAQLISTAKKYLGINYKYGGCTASGFDCSGLTQKIFAEHGIDIERTAAEQAKMGNTLSCNELKSGDLVFFGDKKGQVDHVGIVLRRSIRNLIIIHSTSSGGVMLDDIETSKYWTKKLQYGIDVLSNIF